MRGPGIVARSLSKANVRDSRGVMWQYHSRSDNHSKIACWALLLDLLEHCPSLVDHVASGKVGFGINHPMREFQTGREKYLDLVLCTPGPQDQTPAVTFRELADQYCLHLVEDDFALLRRLPTLKRCSVGSVHVALEAKACMTEHVKALPRLFDELNSSHAAIHGSADYAIATGFAIVNLAATFVSPDRNKHLAEGAPPIVTKHRQPLAAVRTVAKIREIPRRTTSGVPGFDALGILVVKLANDGTEVSVVEGPPAPPPSDVLEYGQMVRRIAGLYASKFANV
jgi:hypothetical protein